MKMRFDSEEEMKHYVVGRLFKDIKQLFDITKAKIFQEIPYAAGKTDLVVVNVSEKYFFRRIKQKKLTRSISNPSYLKIYLQLKEMGSIDKTSFLDRFNDSKSSVSRALNWLEKHKYLEFDKGIIKPVERFNKHVTISCAFELKLSDWKTALLQAHRAKSFSNMQFVVLDDIYVKPALENKDLFEKHNVGLISISPNSKCKVHFYPEKKKPFSIFGTWRLNELTMEEIQIA